MDSCIQKNQDSSPTISLPESGNSLVAINSDQSGGIAQKRKTDDLPETPTPAKPTKPALIHDFWINAGLLSFHPTDHNHQFNDFNYGAGIEFDKSKTWAFAAGEYRNSVRHNSYYGMVEFKPLHVGPLAAGIAGGTINGYPDMNKGKFFPAAMPIASVEEKHVGANFIYIPNVVKGVVPALSMQLKFRF